eukprot:6200950-Pleurochrysis_carterae.AAC.1
MKRKIWCSITACANCELRVRSKRIGQMKSSLLKFWLCTYECMLVASSPQDPARSAYMGMAESAEEI